MIRRTSPPPSEILGLTTPWVSPSSQDASAWIECRMDQEAPELPRRRRSVDPRVLLTQDESMTARKAQGSALGIRVCSVGSTILIAKFYRAFLLHRFRTSYLVYDFIDHPFRPCRTHELPFHDTANVRCSSHDLTEGIRNLSSLCELTCALHLHVIKQTYEPSRYISRHGRPMSTPISQRQLSRSHPHTFVLPSPSPSSQWQTTAIYRPVGAQP